MTEGPADTSNFICIKLRSLVSSEVEMKIKKTVRIEKVKRFYCRVKNFDYTSVFFCYNGREIGEDATALSLNIKDGDVIQVTNEN